jgi:hypothetical protein
MQFKAVGRSKHFGGQKMIQPVLKERVLLLFHQNLVGRDLAPLVPTALAISKMHPFYNIVTFLGKKSYLFSLLLMTGKPMLLSIENK